MNLSTIKAAFQAVKLRPAQRMFFGEGSCCLLSAFYLKANPGTTLCDATDVLQWADKNIPNRSTIVSCWDGRNDFIPEIVKARKHYFGT